MSTSVTPLQAVGTPRTPAPQELALSKHHRQTLGLPSATSPLDPGSPGRPLTVSEKLGRHGHPRKVTSPRIEHSATGGPALSWEGRHCRPGATREPAQTRVASPEPPCIQHSPPHPVGPYTSPDVTGSRAALAPLLPTLLQGIWSPQGLSPGPRGYGTTGCSPHLPPTRGSCRPQAGQPSPHPRAFAPAVLITVLLDGPPRRLIMGGVSRKGSQTFCGTAAPSFASSLGTVATRHVFAPLSPPPTRQPPVRHVSVAFPDGPKHHEPGNACAGQTLSGHRKVLPSLPGKGLLHT